MEPRTLKHRLAEFACDALIILCAIFVLSTISGCNSFNSTRYANNNVEHFEKESKASAAMGNATAQTALFNAESASPGGPSTGAGFDGQGDGDRTSGWMVAGDAARSSDVDTAAVLSSMKDNDRTVGSTTAPQAVDTSQATADSVTSPTITSTPTVSPLSGNQVQTPLQGSSTGAANMGQGTQTDSGETTSTQDNTKTYTPDCTTCGKDGTLDNREDCPDCQPLPAPE